MVCTAFYSQHIAKSH